MLLCLKCVCVCVFPQSVQQQLAEEESSGQALRDELNSKDQQLMQLRSAVKEVRFETVLFVSVFV